MYLPVPRELMAIIQALYGSSTEFAACRCNQLVIGWQCAFQERPPYSGWQMGGEYYGPQLCVWCAEQQEPSSRTSHYQAGSTQSHSDNIFVLADMQVLKPYIRQALGFAQSAGGPCCNVTACMSCRGT